MKIFLLFFFVCLAFQSYSQAIETTIKQASAFDHKKIYKSDSVDQKAIFPGGEKLLYKFLYENIHYPADAREKKKSGNVEAIFVVEQDGSVSSPRILRGVWPSIDAEVMRLLLLLPSGWTPAEKDGIPVRSEFLLPVRFFLQ
jgi:hypothetical protein